jgi:rhodanese-related sulfurtransferase
MNTTRILHALTAVLLVALCFACGDDDDAPEPGETVLLEIGADDLHAALDNKDFILINVHVPRDGELPGTDTHIAFTDPDALASYIGAGLDTRVIIYCKTDHMAEVVGPELLARGYTTVSYLKGGMLAWEAAGYELAP